jgi:hypothetical protein
MRRVLVPSGRVVAAQSHVVDGVTIVEQPMVIATGRA